MGAVATFLRSNVHEKPEKKGRKAWSSNILIKFFRSEQEKKISRQPIIPLSEDSQLIFFVPLRRQNFRMERRWISATQYMIPSRYRDQQQKAIRCFIGCFSLIFMRIDWEKSCVHGSDYWNSSNGDVKQTKAKQCWELKKEKWQRNCTSQAINRRKRNSDSPPPPHTIVRHIFLRGNIFLNGNSHYVLRLFKKLNCAIVQTTLYVSMWREKSHRIIKVHIIKFSRSQICCKWKIVSAEIKLRKMCVIVKSPSRLRFTEP